MFIDIIFTLAYVQDCPRKLESANVLSEHGSHDQVVYTVVSSDLAAVPSLMILPVILPIFKPSKHLRA